MDSDRYWRIESHIHDAMSAETEDERIERINRYWNKLRAQEFAKLPGWKQAKIVRDPESSANDYLDELTELALGSLYEAQGKEWGDVLEPEP